MESSPGAEKRAEWHRGDPGFSDQFPAERLIVGAPERGEIGDEEVGALASKRAESRCAQRSGEPIALAQ